MSFVAPGSSTWHVSLRGFPQQSSRRLFHASAHPLSIYFLLGHLVAPQQGHFHKVRTPFNTIMCSKGLKRVPRLIQCTSYARLRAKYLKEWWAALDLQILLTEKPSPPNPLLSFREPRTELKPQRFNPLPYIFCWLREERVRHRGYMGDNTVKPLLKSPLAGFAAPLIYFRLRSQKIVTTGVATEAAKGQRGNH